MNDDVGDAPVLVVVVNNPVDLHHAQAEGWYRIPLDRAPAHIGAEYLAFYQTSAFPPAERWSVNWLAPIHAYRISTRRELIPDEPDHPRAACLYYRVVLGPMQALPHPIPSRRLRRITFIPTTLSRLRSATEINDLWIKSTAQERLWTAMKETEIEAERQYPLSEDNPAQVADFAIVGRNERVAIIVVDEPPEENGFRECPTADYQLAAAGWRPLLFTQTQLLDDLGACLEALKAVLRTLR